ncbi:hypothetical protein J2X20_003672 [Pelomonas saccharophila]|uniref:Uncharacterized protein n=1 Tax=Roseateles saccharophilus TaxID=304 RepID=A0ABU1YQ77_ROSSA|nr:hypothetical protein [Roseateles saccharophilus]MDR7271014.1 hypothetical protein [Roseateles saccharophilus]
MIESLVKVYTRSDRDIGALTYVVVAFLTAFAVRAAMLVYERKFDDVWPLLPQAVPLLAVLVAVRVANRLLSNNNIIREDDRRQELVRTTHHLIAITKDLRARVGYAKAILTDGGRPRIALVQIAKSIEDRYETLLQRDGYRFLPGSCVDIITRISGDVFGIAALAEGIKQVTAAEPNSAFVLVPAKGDSPLSPQLDTLMADLQQLLDQLFELRDSIHPAKVGSEQ